MIGMYTWLIYCLSTYLVWTLVRQLYCTYQKILWKLDGTSSRIQKNYHGQSYKGTVQLLKVLAKYKFDHLGQQSGVDNFISSHEGFRDPEYVLQDHVSLFCVNKNEAIWVEVEKGLHPAKCEYSAFFHIAQWKLAKKLLIMPIHIFNQLGSKVGTPKGAIIFLSNTGRCGSTLMIRMFAETETCLAFSEPDSINAISQLTGVMPDTERVKILRTSINLLCKHLYSQNIQAYIIKLSQPTMIDVPYIKELFPSSYHVFLYRDGLPVARSLAKCSNGMPIAAMMQICGRWSGSYTKQMINQMGLYAEHFEQKLYSDLQFGTIMWASAIRQYLDFKEQGIDIVAAKYEDIMKEPNVAFQKILEYCGLPFDAKAVESVTSEDSQRDSPLNMKHLKGYKPDAFTDKVKFLTDKICDQFKVPRIPETFVVTGTITSMNSD